MIDDYCANTEERFIMYLDDWAYGKNWWYWFNKFFKKHTTIAESYRLFKAEGKDDKQFDVRVLDMDYKPINVMELKQDDLTRDMSQLEYELQEVYLPLLNETGLDVMDLVCAKSKGLYERHIIKQVIGVCNRFPWVRLHIHDNPLDAVKRVDNIIRYPPAKIENTIPDYVRKGRKGFTHSLCALMDGISIELADWLIDFIHPDVTEWELQKAIDEFYNDGKNYSEKAFKLYINLQKTWYKDERDKNRNEF